MLCTNLVPFVAVLWKEVSNVSPIAHVPCCILTTVTVCSHRIRSLNYIIVGSPLKRERRTFPAHLWKKDVLKEEAETLNEGFSTLNRLKRNFSAVSVNHVLTLGFWEISCPRDCYKWIYEGFYHVSMTSS